MRLEDREQIKDVLHLYARSVDRADHDGLRRVFHPDAIDDHGPYQGGVDGFIAFLKVAHPVGFRMQHVINNCIIDFAGPDLALVETYFTAMRQPTAEERAGMDTDLYVQSWGRYVDRFERRNGEWRIARRCVVLDARVQMPHLGVPGGDAFKWGSQDDTDPLLVARRQLAAGAAPS